MSYIIQRKRPTHVALRGGEHNTMLIVMNSQRKHKVIAYNTFRCSRAPLLLDAVTTDDFAPTCEGLPNNDNNKLLFGIWIWQQYQATVGTGAKYKSSIANANLQESSQNAYDDDDDLSRPIVYMYTFASGKQLA